MTVWASFVLTDDNIQEGKSSFLPSHVFQKPETVEPHLCVFLCLLCLHLLFLVLAPRDQVSKGLSSPCVAEGPANRPLEPRWGAQHERSRWAAPGSSQKPGYELSHTPHRPPTSLKGIPEPPRSGFWEHRVSVQSCHGAEKGARGFTEGPGSALL